MKSRFRRFLTSVAILCLVATSKGWADDKMPNSQGNINAQRSNLTENDMIFQSSKLSDLNVYNLNDTTKELGNVDNLVINEHTGNVLFAVLDTGLGGKKIAVPWSAFKLHKGGDAKEKFWLSLNKTQEDLKTAPTFDTDNIAQAINTDWQQSVQKFFGVQRVAKPEDLQGSGDLKASQLIFPSSKLGDLNVYNRKNTDNKLGNLDNLIIDAHMGTVQYAVLDTGIGGKKIAVPWDALLLQKQADDNEYWLTLDKTEDELKNAPTFQDDGMPQLTDAKWQQTVDSFFGVRTATRPEQHHHD